MMKTIRIILIGLTAGIVNGFFATGGGMILLPAFTNLLYMDEKESRGTAIFCILPMVITSSIFYYKGNYLDWKISILCAIGGSIGGFFGAKLLKKLPNKVIKTVFIILIIYVSYKMIINQ